MIAKARLNNTINNCATLSSSNLYTLGIKPKFTLIPFVFDNFPHFLFFFVHRFSNSMLPTPLYMEVLGRNLKLRNVYEKRTCH